MGFIRKMIGFLSRIFGAGSATTAPSSRADMPRASEPAPVKKVLVIDDDSSLLELMSHTLKKKGYEVACGLDSREALDLAPKLMPDLIILDIMIPGIQGNEVSMMFKTDASLKHIPIVLMSSDHEGLSEKFKASLADGYLPKPFDLGELGSIAGRYCGQTAY